MNEFYSVKYKPCALGTALEKSIVFCCTAWVFVNPAKLSTEKHRPKNLKEIIPPGTIIVFIFGM